MSSKYHI